MNNQAFEDLLKLAGLSKKEFADRVEMNSNSVTNWNKSDKIPQWVASWLNLYIDNAECAKLKAIIEEAVCSKDD